MTNLQKMIEDVQGIAEKNKQLEQEVEQGKKLIAALHEEMKANKERLKEFEPFADIIGKEDKEQYLITIRDALAYKQAKIRARQVLGPSGDIGYRFMKFIEIVLRDSLNIGWLNLKRRNFSGTGQDTQVRDDDT